MRWRISIVAALALFAAAACDADLPTMAEDEAEVSAPGFKVVQNERVPWTWRQQNACTGEWMSGEILMRTKVQEHVDGAGVYHYRLSLNGTGGKMVGETTGVVCRLNGPWSQSFKVEPGAMFPIQYSFKWVIVYACPGPNNDIRSHSTVVIRANANHELTVWKESERSECLGPNEGGPI